MHTVQVCSAVSLTTILKIYFTILNHTIECASMHVEPAFTLFVCYNGGTGLNNEVLTVTESISFIHAADLHLDSPFAGLSHVPEPIFSTIRESTFTALDRLVQAAIDKQVDFVLLVGDLFDHEQQSLNAQVRLRQAFEALERHGIQVYLSYGNHDYISGNRHPMDYPDNVHIFPDETVRSFIFAKNGTPVAAIYGFSYENRAVHQNKAEEYKLDRAAMPFHIATLHGSLATNTDHD